MKKVNIISTVVQRQISSEKIPTGNNVTLNGVVDIDEIRKELSKNFISFDDFKSYWEIKTDAYGNKYIYSPLHIATQNGITMYAGKDGVNIPSIYDGLPIDSQTIYWEDIKDGNGVVIGKILKAKTGGGTLGSLTNVGEWADSVASVDRIMVQKKGSDTWEAMDVSGIGSASFENISESGEGNAYTSFTLSDDKKSLYLVKGQTFITASESEDITGIKNFINGLQINGVELKYDSTNNAVFIQKSDGSPVNFYSTGGISMYGQGNTSVKTIMDAITANLDTNTLAIENGLLTVVGGTGGIESITKQMVIDALGFTPYDASNPNGYITSATLDGFLPLSGGALNGNLYFGTESSDINRTGEVSRFPSHFYRNVYEYNGQVYDHYYNQKYTASQYTYANLRVKDGSGFRTLRFGGDGIFTWSGNIVLDAGNFNTYAPTLTGGGASGNWNIYAKGITPIGRITDDSFEYFNNSIGFTRGISICRVESSAVGDIPAYSTVVTLGVDSSRFIRLAAVKGTGRLVFQTANATNNGFSSVFNILTDQTYGAFLDSVYLKQSSYTAADILDKLKTVDGADSGLDADTVDGYHIASEGTREHPWGKIPIVRLSDGVMEVGQYMDFHYDTSFRDYSTRIHSKGNHGNTVVLPSANGTIALITDNVASATKLQTPRTIWGQSFDGTGDVNGVLTFINLGGLSPTIKWSNGEYFDNRGNFHLAASSGDFNVFNSSSGVLFRIVHSSGNVGIGTTSPSAKLHVEGNILATGGVTMYSQRSLKNVVDERGLSLSELSAIKPTRYKWKDNRDNRIHFGGIADDIQQVLPEVVYKTNDGVLTMDYGNAAFAIVSSLIQPVISHEQRIKALERENELLKQELNRLRA